MALDSVKVIYETVGSQNVIKAVRGSEVPDSELQAAVAAVAGWDGFATIAAAQLTTYDKRNALLGLEYYDDAGTSRVRAVVPSDAYKVAERRPVLTANLRRQIEEVQWGLGLHFSEARTRATGMWLRKTAAVIALDAVVQSDTNYGYLLADTRLDATKWLVTHDTDTWPGYLGDGIENRPALNTHWYRTDASGSSWTGVQVVGVSVSSGWHTKDLLAELIE